MYIQYVLIYDDNVDLKKNILLHKFSDINVVYLPKIVTCKMRINFFNFQKYW